MAITKCKAYLGIKYHADNRNRDQIEALSGALINAGLMPTCIARDVEKWGAVQLSPQALMQIAFDEIDRADVIVLEMTKKGVGLGIEAGYAVARGKRLIVLTKDEQGLSNTMRGIADRVIEYSVLMEIEEYIAPEI